MREGRSQVQSAALRRSLGCLMAMVALATIGVVMIPLAGAAGDEHTVTVPCSGDGGGPAGIATGVKTLNQSGGGQLILAARCTYSFTSPFSQGNAMDKITTAITVIGDQATLDRDAKNNNPYRFFEVASGGDLYLLHMGMRGGRQSSGGALLIDQGGTARLQSVNMAENRAEPNGGAIYDEGTLSMEGSILTHNSAIAGNAKDQLSAFGGGLRITASGTADIRSSDVTDNVLVPSYLRPVLGGAGIFNNGKLTVTGSLIKGNSITTGDRDAGSAAGAGIGNFGTLTLDHSTVEDNTMSLPRGGTSTGSGVWNAGTFTSTGSTITGNTSGGVGDVAEGAGVYAATGKVDLVDTRITKNKAGGSHPRGGGVELSDTEHVDITVQNSPITDNAPVNCVPVALVPTCKNGAKRTRPSG